MKITIRDVEYKVRFRHDPPDLFERETVCDFFDGEKLVYTGWANCVEGDNFDRAIGRVISLNRAIKDLPVEDQAKVWIDYFKLHRPPHEWVEFFTTMLSGFPRPLRREVWKQYFVALKG